MFPAPTMFMNTWPPVDVTVLEGYGTLMIHGTYMKKKVWTVFENFSPNVVPALKKKPTKSNLRTMQSQSKFQYNFSQILKKQYSTSYGKTNNSG